MWMQRSTYLQPRHQEEVGWLVLHSGAFPQRKAPGTHFIGGWVDIRTSLDTKERRKISTPSDSRGRTWAVQPVAQQLAAWATWPTDRQRNGQTNRHQRWKLLGSSLFCMKRIKTQNGAEIITPIHAHTHTLSLSLSLSLSPSTYLFVYRVSFKSTDKLQKVIPDCKWYIKVRITLCPEMQSFHGRWHCRTTSNKEPWHTVHGPNPIHVTTDVRSGFHGTHDHTNSGKLLQMLCDVVGTACQGTWLGTFMLPLDRFHLLGYTRTPSRLVLGMNTGPLCFYIA